MGPTQSRCVEQRIALPTNALSNLYMKLYLRVSPDGFVRIYSFKFDNF